LVVLSAPSFLFAGEGWGYSHEWFKEVYANCELSSGEPYSLERCIGHATELCVARSEDPDASTVYLDCIRSEAKSWELLWHEMKPEILAHLDLLNRIGGHAEGAAHVAFEESQVDWRQYLETHCAFVAYLQPNPANREDDEAFCRLDATARRVQFLLDLMEIQ
jgi:hypothetical protein